MKLRVFEVITTYQNGWERQFGMMAATPESALKEQLRVAALHERENRQCGGTAQVIIGVRLVDGQLEGSS